MKNEQADHNNFLNQEIMSEKINTTTTGRSWSAPEAEGPLAGKPLLKSGSLRDSAG